MHVDSKNESTLSIPIFMESVQIPYANTAKYLGMTLVANLRWNEHNKIKIMELQLKWKKINWLIERKSKLSTENEFYKYYNLYRLMKHNCGDAQVKKYNYYSTFSEQSTQIHPKGSSDLHCDLGVNSIR